MEIRELLKKYNIYKGLQVLGSKNSNQDESLQEVLKRLFETDVLNKASSDPTYSNMSDFSIHVKVNASNEPFDVQLGVPLDADSTFTYKCHFLILVLRWKLFRERFIVSFEEHGKLDLSELTLSIVKNIAKVKEAGGITVKGVELNEFLNMLCFVYSNSFTKDPPACPTNKTAVPPWQAIIKPMFVTATNMNIVEVMEMLAYEFAVRGNDNKFVSQLRQLSTSAGDVIDRMTEIKKCKIKSAGKAMHHTLTYTTVEKYKSLELPKTLDPIAKEADAEIAIDKKEAEMKKKLDEQLNRIAQKLQYHSNLKYVESDYYARALLNLPQVPNAPVKKDTSEMSVRQKKEYEQYTKLIKKRDELLKQRLEEEKKIEEARIKAKTNFEETNHAVIQKLQSDMEGYQKRYDSEKQNMQDRKKRLEMQREEVVYHQKIIRILSRELADTIVYTRYDDAKDEEEDVPAEDEDFVAQVSKLSTSKFNPETEELSTPMTPITPSTPIMSVPNLHIIYAHRLMLIIRSQYFRMLLTGAFAEYTKSKGIFGKYKAVEVEEITFNSLLHILQYMYTEDMNVNTETAIDMMFCANKMNFTDLASRCESNMIEHMEAEYATQLYCVANFLAATDLKTAALRVMVQHTCTNPKEHVAQAVQEIKDYFGDNKKQANSMIANFAVAYAEKQCNNAKMPKFEDLHTLEE